MHKLLALGSALLLVACASAEQKAAQKPERRWDVKVSKGNQSEAAPSDRIWVAKEDGSKQCEKGSALTVASATSQFQSAGILVYQGRTGHDGMVRTAVCGSGTGRTVELEIPRNELGKAVSMGFQSVPTQN